MYFIVPCILQLWHLIFPASILESSIIMRDHSIKLQNGSIHACHSHLGEIFRAYSRLASRAFWSWQMHVNREHHSIHKAPNV